MWVTASRLRWRVKLEIGAILTASAYGILRRESLKMGWKTGKADRKPMICFTRAMNEA
ncbi:hypothetical protein D3C73_515630 [compost metagenome]